jgi:FtsH-binding integral membrane protein
MQAPLRDESSLSRSGSIARVDATNVFLAKVFQWMALGLAITGFIAYYTASSGLVHQILGSRMLFYALLFAQLGLVFFLSARIDKIQPGTATGLFVAYAALTGLTLSVIFIVFTQASIASTFFITAGMFGAMAIYGHSTKRDLSEFGSFLFMGLIGIIIASVVNFFLKSPMLYWIISGVGVLVFTGLTAYDVQKIKKIGEAGILERGDAAVRRGAIIGALALYLDFINLFLMFLRLFGRRR